MKTWILSLALLSSIPLAFAQAPRPSLAERSAQTEVVAKLYFDAYIARDWDRLEPLLDEQIRFDDATAHLVFGAVGKQGKAVLMKAFRETSIRRASSPPASTWSSWGNWSGALACPTV